MPVLGTKLHVPSPRRRLVPRTRLIERLDDPRSAPRLVLVAAPAGSGKTTVLTQWLTAADPDAPAPVRRVAWLSLDEDDSDVRRFLGNVVAALRTTDPDVGTDALALLAADRGPATEDVLVSLLNDLDTVAQPTVLALDDYHVLDDPAVHEAVSFLLDNLPRQVTVAITTRADPPLPLARLRARGELVELRAADLRFTEEEAGRFLNDVMGLGLDDQHVAALGNRTEGWAAGLQLAALSALGRAGSGGVEEFVDAFSGSHRFVLDYLLDEVLRSQPDDVRAFLLATSALRELSGPLCDAVTGGSGGQEVLERLERSGLFVVPLDDQRQWFRYHHLFADALRAQLGSSDPGRLRRSHASAARWYAAQGRLADAITHALAADDPEPAADLLELALGGLRRRRENRALRTWLVALPEDVVLRRPLLAAGLAWARLTVGDLDGAAACLDAAEAGLVAPPPAAPAPGTPAEPVADRDSELHALPATIEVFRASVAQARGDVARTVLHAQRARELSGPLDHVSRSGGAGFLALAAWAAGDLSTAVTTFTEAVDSMRAAGMVADELGATVALADMWLARSGPLEARRLFERALAAAADHRVAALPATGDLHVGLADALRESGELDEAAEHLQTARELGDVASLIENRFRWHTATAGLLRARGDLDAAVAAFEHGRSAYLRGFFPDTRPVAAAVARVRIAQGRLPEAWAWAREQGVRADQEPTYLAEFDLLTLARLLVASHRSEPELGAVDAATRLVDRLLEAAESADRGGSVVEARLVRALAHHARGDEEAALDDLGHALVQGVPAGFVQLFLDEGPVLVELLEAAASPGLPGAEHAAALLRVVARRRTSPVDGAAQPPAGEDVLSEREREVLRLLATELTGPEIAARLFVSVNTLRTHTKHVFTKLDVNTRRAAVRRGTELGLL